MRLAVALGGGLALTGAVIGLGVAVSAPSPIAANGHHGALRAPSSTTVAPASTTPTPTTTPTTATVAPTTATVAPTTVASAAVAPACNTTPGGVTAAGGGQQLIVVDTASPSATQGTLTTWSLNGTCWQPVAGPYPARVGYSGISTDKHEGDGATPEGIFDFEATMYGNAPNPGVHYPYVALVCGDWWDEDSDSPTYNTFVQVPCSETDPPFNNGSSEALWTETRAYPSFAVINYNPGRIPGAGSAIFLHADVGGPTDGCVSLPLGALDAVLDWMRPAAGPHIVIATSATLSQY